MTKKWKKGIAMLVCVGIMTQIPACANKYESVYLLDEDRKASDVALEYYEKENQVSKEDIEEYSDENAVIVYRDDGYVSSLVGRFSPDQVESSDDVLKALATVYDLLGFGEDTEYYLASQITDTQTDYTYFTYKQMAGNQSVENGSLVIVRDADHYVCALSNSFSSEIVKSEQMITAQEAETIVQTNYPQLTIYSQYTKEVYFNHNNVLTKAMAVYTDNPDISQSFQMPYLMHYISNEGTYLICTPTSTVSTTDTKGYHNEDYFSGMDETVYETTVQKADGTTEAISVPVCYNKSDGLYYMMDPKRLIAAASFYDFYVKDEVNFITSTNNNDWDMNYILAYANYIEAWDFYKTIGVPSIDRAGMPILIGMGMCDSKGNPVDNAGYYGSIMGWGFFGVSDVNKDSQALDVVAHEFTHGYTSHAMQGCIYANEQGAINESLSDIMGNLVEMYDKKTEDETWSIGESCGNVFRKMSDPIAYHQPSFVGDAFYVPKTDHPNASLNDYGGVHSNSSLLNKVAYDLYAASVPLSHEIMLWLDTIEFLTPQSDLDDVYVGLILSCRAHSEYHDYEQIVHDSYEKMGMMGDREQTAKDNQNLRSNYFELSVATEAPDSAVVLYDANGHYYASYSPDADGNARVRAEIGKYYLVYAKSQFGNVYCYYYTGSSWSANDSAAKLINFDKNVVYEKLEIY
ncbi:M4 family metallopeptidase [Agathobacter ruminis]|uniref:Neutral metalloproteinase n=1 Tax=Agathobacter ruminis TaxID=1712665 RepID=A0A2G3E5D7_9FIRM|nr:M4 family metallopeptidase [Agathobacter ruminis]MDC7301072.1 M4 family metallopeptidase [Agathobacter ruminis]PHU38464.1 hypothetical protein CSX02_02700 [Agathobacter ruminis]